MKPRPIAPEGFQPVARTEPLPPQHQPRVLISLATAALWVVGGEGLRWWLFALPALPLLLGPAMALSSKIHDIRVHQLHAASGVVSALLALFNLLTGGGWTAVVLLALSVWVFLAAGRVALRYEPSYEGAEVPVESTGMDAKAAVDEALLAYFVGVAKIPGGPQAEALSIEAMRLGAVLKENGWLADPASFHETPDVPSGVAVDSLATRGIAYERVSYASGFVPRPELPGAAEWQSQIANQRSVLRVFRHAGAPRPWLVCLHGYRMGYNWLDFGLFPPAVLHRKLGFNVLMPTLPLHGPRKSGGSSGDGFLDGNLIRFVHAQSQALWDLRRALAWLRDREPGAQIGVYGISLGGYNAALLATYEAELSFVLAGIPLADTAGVLWRHLPAIHKRFYAQHGLGEAEYREMVAVVSPLARPALPAQERLHLFAATGDRIVTPDQPLLLARHWQRQVQWYQGAHLSIRHEAVPRAALKSALAGAGWQ